MEEKQTSEQGPTKDSLHEIMEKAKLAMEKADNLLKEWKTIDSRRTEEERGWRNRRDDDWYMDERIKREHFRWIQETEQQERQQEKEEEEKLHLFARLGRMLKRTATPEQRKDAFFQSYCVFDRFWTAICQDFSIGHYAPRPLKRNCSHCGDRIKTVRHGNQTLCDKCRDLPFQRIKRGSIEPSTGK